MASQVSDAVLCSERAKGNSQGVTECLKTKLTTCLFIAYLFIFRGECTHSPPTPTTKHAVEIPTSGEIPGIGTSGVPCVTTSLIRASPLPGQSVECTLTPEFSGGPLPLHKGGGEVKEQRDQARRPGPRPDDRQLGLGLGCWREGAGTWTQVPERTD